MTTNIKLAQSLRAGHDHVANGAQVLVAHETFGFGIAMLPDTGILSRLSFFYKQTSLQ